MDYRSTLIDAYRLATGPFRGLKLRNQIANQTVPVSVLFYHRVSDRSPNPWTISCSGFSDQLDWLEANVELISVDEVCRRLQQKRNDRPAVAITFDDGYADNMDFAIPEMVRRCIPLTYYVANRFVTNQSFFPHDLELGQRLFPNSSRDLKTMARWGVTIGAHSMDHVDFGKLTKPMEIKDQIVGCKKELENMLGQEVRHFAFPFGQHCNISTQAVQIAHQSGFQSVAGAYGGYNFVGQNPFFIQRLHGDPSIARIKNWIEQDPRLNSVQPNPAWLEGISGPAPTTESLQETERNRPDRSTASNESPAMDLNFDSNQQNPPPKPPQATTPLG